MLNTLRIGTPANMTSHFSRNLKDLGERRILVNNNPSSPSRSRRGRRWGLPAAATGAGGTAIVIWFEEIMASAMEIIGLLLLSVLAGVIYLFNICLFNSAMPKTDEKEKIKKP
jgi:hypothetical protein